MLTYVFLACIANVAFGLPHNPPKARISGGHEVDIQQYPYHVQIHENTTMNDGTPITIYQNCDGAIITPKHVVSTAACINPYDIEIDPYSVTVKVNASYIYSGTGKFIPAKKLTLHPYYYNDHYVLFVDYNIGVIELSETLEFGPGIQAIGLPQPGAYPAPETIVSVTGFGGRYYGDVIHTDSKLQALQTAIISNDQCTKDFLGDVVVSERQICTNSLTGKSEGPCRGDGASPLAFEGILHGLYDYGDCGYDGHSTIYTSLAGLVDFVHDVIDSSS